MPQTLQTRHPLLRESEAKALADIARYRRFAHIDLRDRRIGALSLWRRLTRSAVKDIRDVRRTQAEIG